MAIRRRTWTPAVSFLLFISLAASAQNSTGIADNGNSQPLFANQATLAIRIEAPFTTLMRERSETEQIEGILRYTDSTGAEKTLDVKLRARGIYRRQEDTCEFAPIRLNFRKTQVMGTEFAGQDKLKLVTHCQDDSDSYEQYVLKEFLAYRIFNVLTDYSFGARLLYVTYSDSDREGEEQSRYAFVIEDNDLLAERIGARKVEIRSASYPQLEESQASLVAVFNYLIGNTDYSMIRPDKDKECCHNIELFSFEPDRYIIIPYDFDFSGIVDARYAEPHPSLDIRSVVRRRYRGVCDFNDAMDAALAQFKANETAIRQLPSTIDGMEERVREKAVRYIEDFYEDIRDRESVEKNLLKKCYAAS